MLVGYNIEKKAMNAKQLKQAKAQLARLQAQEAAHQAWLNKFGRGCKHENKQVSVSHPASGLQVFRCAHCGVQVD